MSENVREYIDKLLIDRFTGQWKDGWVYGRLKQAFSQLEEDELYYMATRLKFIGWNAMTQEVLADQWREEELRWLESETFKAEQRREQALKKEALQEKLSATIQGLRDPKPQGLEGSLIRAIQAMSDADKIWLAHTIYNRFVTHPNPLHHESNPPLPSA